MLIEWLRKEKELVIRSEFPQRLNDILLKEKGMRKHKIVDEMAKDDHVIQAMEFIKSLFDDYKEKELPGNVST